MVKILDKKITSRVISFYVVAAMLILLKLQTLKMIFDILNRNPFISSFYTKKNIYYLIICTFFYQITR